MPVVVMEAICHHHRRFPHLARADVEALDVLRAVRGPAAARAYERLLEAQHRDATRLAERHVLLEDVERDASRPRRRCAA